MDPLTSIGLLANVLQFGELALTLAREAKAIYRSADGAPEKATNLRALAHTFKRSGNLSQPICADEPSDWAPLRLQCEQVADRLLNQTNDLKIRSKSRAEASIIALKWMRRKGKLDGILTELELLGSRITQMNVELIRAHQSSIHTDIRKLIDEFDHHGASTQEQLAKIYMEMQTLGSSLSRERMSKLDTDRLVREVADKVFVLSKQEEAAREQIAILDSLRFALIEARHEEIPEAHSSTFRWIHEPKTPAAITNTFQEWLESEGAIFWISGNAGSGKSTLMKYIVDHSRTRELLNTWRGSSHLLVAAFYFWKPGTELQKSIKGLLRALLYEIFRQCPTLIKFTASRTRSAMSRNLLRLTDRGLTDVHRHVYEWTMTDLKETLTNVLRQSEFDIKTCLFIDGLDEYEGSIEDILVIVRELSASHKVKLCFSSRPLNHLKSFFKQMDIGDDNSLRLHEHTMGDISNFVSQKLDACARFSSTFTTPSARLGFKESVAGRAEGVFLWADLAVQNMVKALENGDTPLAIDKKLNSLPDSERIEDMFRRMLQDVAETTYREEAAVILKVVAFADRLFGHRLNLLSLPYVDPDADHTANSLDRSGDVCAADAIESDELLELCERRLNARCNGLVKCFRTVLRDSAVAVPRMSPTSPDTPMSLELKASSAFPRWQSVKAGFIHRSVVEFLETEIGCEYVAGGNVSNTCDTAILVASRLLVCISRMLSTLCAIHDLLEAIDDLFWITRYLGYERPRAVSLILEQLYQIFSQHVEPDQEKRSSSWKLEKAYCHFIRRETGYWKQSGRVSSYFIASYHKTIPLLTLMEVPNPHWKNELDRKEAIFNPGRNVLEQFLLLIMYDFHLLKDQCFRSGSVSHNNSTIWHLEGFRAYIAKYGLDEIQGLGFTYFSNRGDYLHRTFGTYKDSWQEEKSLRYRARILLPVDLCLIIGIGASFGDASDQCDMWKTAVSEESIPCNEALKWSLRSKRLKRFRADAPGFLRELACRMDDVDLALKATIFLHVAEAGAGLFASGNFWPLIRILLECGANPNSRFLPTKRVGLRDLLDDVEEGSLLRFRGPRGQFPKRKRGSASEAESKDEAHCSRLIESWSLEHTAWEVYLSLVMSHQKLRGTEQALNCFQGINFTNGMKAEIIRVFLQAGASTRGRYLVGCQEHEISELIESIFGGIQSAPSAPKHRAHLPAPPKLTKYDSMEAEEDSDEAWFSADEFI